MDPHIATTPFGRRPVSLGQIKARARLRETIEDAAKPGSNHPAAHSGAVDKWRLFRTLAEIREPLGVSDRTLGVLNALLSFHPEVALSLPGEGEGAHLDLVVFPSNKALSLRAHGMPEKTLRRHLAALVEAGLILRRDSPNGKRYARKGEDAEVRFSDAFGFDLTPLVARAGEFEALAEETRRHRRLCQAARERISLHRRDLAKLIAMGLEEELPGDWEGYRLRFLALLTPVRRIRDDALQTVVQALALLRGDVGKALDGLTETAELTGNDGVFDRRISNSKTQSHHELEPSSKEKGARREDAEGSDAALVQASAPATEAAAETKAFPLGMVLEACPDVKEYAPGGRIRSWPDFLAAAAVVRPMVGVSPDAWREARHALGEVEAHVAVATILQRSIHSSEAETRVGEGGQTEVRVNGSPAIRSAGGYLRALTEQARAGQFALGPVLMALIGQRLKARRTRRGEER
jgi:replication initiation protein RepC